MTETPFTGVDGRFVQMPPRNVVPKPMQKPHPPLWVACSRRDTILLAAEKGIGALTFAFIDPEEASKWVSDYERTLAERCVPVGLAVNSEHRLRHPDDVPPRREGGARPGSRGRQLLRLLARALLRLRRAPARVRPTSGPSTSSAAAIRATRPRSRRRCARSGSGPSWPPATAPACAARRARRRRSASTSSASRQAGVDQVIFVLQAGKNRHEHICESLELFGREVLPGLQGARRGAGPGEGGSRSPRRSRPPWSGGRTSRHRPRCPPDYSFPAMPRRWADETGSEEMREWLEHFAEARAKGIRDEGLGILGD